MKRLPCSMGLVGMLLMMPGCGPNYMPLDGFHIIFDTTVGQAGKNARSRALICKPDESICGRRKVADSYDPDAFYLEVEGEEYHFVFEPSGFESSDIEAGYFASDGALDPNQQVRMWLNDSVGVVIDLPPTFQLTKPTQHEEVLLGAGGIVRIEWEPPMVSFPMRWHVFPADNELEVSVCDTLIWGTMDEGGEDKGFVDIPNTFFPSDLPPEGCDVVAIVTRDKEFDLPAGISGGFARSSVVDGVVFRVLP